MYNIYDLVYLGTVHIGCGCRRIHVKMCLVLLLFACETSVLISETVFVNAVFPVCIKVLNWTEADDSRAAVFGAVCYESIFYCIWPKNSLLS